MNVRRTTTTDLIGTSDRILLGTSLQGRWFTFVEAMPTVNDLFSVNPAVLSGCPVFKGTRVPVESLIWHLEKGATVDEFVADFPSVRADQVKGVLDLLGGLLSAEKIRKLHEAAA